jgi:hypothetical protein
MIKTYQYGKMVYVDGIIINLVNIKNKNYKDYKIACRNRVIYLVYDCKNNTIYHEMVPEEYKVQHIVNLLEPNKNYNRLMDKTIAKIIADNISYIETDEQYNKLIIEFKGINHYLRFEDVDKLGTYGVPY